jgi:hypothetical protein
VTGPFAAFVRTEVHCPCGELVAVPFRADPAAFICAPTEQLAAALLASPDRAPWISVHVARSPVTRLDFYSVHVLAEDDEPLIVSDEAQRR